MDFVSKFPITLKEFLPPNFVEELVMKEEMGECPKEVDNKEVMPL